MGKWASCRCQSLCTRSFAIDFVGENFTGEIAEALVFDQEVNSINREKGEGYLAHKWGMVVTFPIYIVIRMNLLRSVVIEVYGED